MPAYRTFEQKMRDAEAYKRDEELPWPLLVDDVEGTVHQVYGGLSDPTYLIDRDGRVSFYDIWSHAPTLHRAIAALQRQGGRGIVLDGIDHMPHLMPALAAGWPGIRRGLPQSYIELELAAPGTGTGLWLGNRLRPVLAPVALRARPLPLRRAAALAALAAGATLLAAGGLALSVLATRRRKRRGLAR